MITFAQVKAEVERLAKEKPDNVYSNGRGGSSLCMYTQGTCQDGSVGCIFGQAFRNLGINPALIAKLDEDALNAAAALHFLNITRLPPSGHVAENWVTAVQNSQDAGDPWGDAVSRLKNESSFKDL